VIKKSGKKYYFAFLIIIVSFLVSCEFEDSVPTASYNVSGTVKSSSDSSVIPGISSKLIVNSGTLLVPVYGTMSGKSSLSGSSGDFSNTISGIITDYFIIRFEDVDGTANGSFKSKDVTIDFSITYFKEYDGKWNFGPKNIDLTDDVLLDPL